MPNGIIVINKPQGWTSMDICAKLRGIFREKRIGHAGTLDPMATGVLPVFIGRATRAVEFASEGQKEYVAGLKLGVVTNTQDTSGEVLETRPFTGTREDLEAVLPQFRGDIQQIPPMYSAIKINGKKLYELARKGREVEIKAKTLVIDEIEVLECGLPAEPTLIVRVVCSKGTYIRALARDIGTALGSGAHLYGLRRTQVGDVRVEQCESLEGVLGRLETEEMVSAEEAEQILLERERIANRERAAILNAQRAKKKRKQEQNNK